MSGGQVFFVALAFVILIAITLAVQFRWLRDGRLKTILVLLSGIAVVASLRIAGLPPDWFSGSWEGFGIAISLMLGAFVTRTAEEKAFGIPLLLGMGVTLLALNLSAVVVKAF